MQGNGKWSVVYRRNWTLAPAGGSTLCRSKAEAENIARNFNRYHLDRTIVRAYVVREGE